MATPTVPEKRLMAAAIKKGSAWGTAVALGATFGALLESDGGLKRSAPYLGAMEADTPFVMEGDLGPVDPVTFSPSFSMRYDPGGLGIAMASFFGTAGNPANPIGGVYQHTIRWADEIYGNFVTFGVERVGKIFEVPSAKPVSLDLTVGGGLIKGSMGFIGDLVKDNSSINTLTQMDAITYADRGNRIKFAGTTVKMNDQTGGAVASETALEVSDLSVHFERPHDNPHKAGSVSIIEPAENGHPIITVELNFPRMNAVNAAYFTTDFIGEVEKKMEIKFQGGTLSGAYTYYWDILFPRLRVIEVDYSWDEVIPSRIKLQAEEAAAAPTGLLYTRPYMFIENARSTDYLT